jgi:hypothetical protein
MDDEWVILVQLLVVGTVIGGVLTYIIRSLVGMLLPSLKNNFFKKATTLHGTLAEIDLKTHFSNLLDGMRRRYH